MADTRTSWRKRRMTNSSARAQDPRVASAFSATAQQIVCKRTLVDIAIQNQVRVVSALLRERIAQWVRVVSVEALAMRNLEQRRQVGGHFSSACAASGGGVGLRTPCPPAVGAATLEKARGSGKADFFTALHFRARTVGFIIKHAVRKQHRDSSARQ